MRTYLDVVRQGPVGLLLLAGVLGRLPQTINGLALVLFIEGETGSYSRAGAVAGGVALGMGAVAPFVGRVADRRGPRVLLPVAVAHAVWLVALILLGGQASTAVLVLLAVLAGASFPPASSVLRARLPVLLQDRRELLGAAFALDAVLVELAFVIGPLLTGLIAVVWAPSLALWVSVVSVLVGTVAFLRVLPPAALEEGHSDGLLGPLRSPAVLTLAASMLPFGFSIGALEVVLPAFGESVGAPNVAGALLAAWAIGSAVGGLAYGARAWRVPVASLHLRFSLLFPLAYLPLLASTSVWSMAVLVLPAGALIAPIFASRNEIVGTFAPAGTATEAVTWPLTTLLCGIALGAAASGALVEASGWRLGVAASVAGAALAALISVARRTTLTGAPPRARLV